MFVVKLNMFNFFIKKSEVVLDCFTYLGTVFDTAKINQAIYFIPEWWKTTPKFQDGQSTIKNCRAFKDYYKYGIGIPSWFEMDVHFFGENDPEGREVSIKYSNNNVDVTKSHSNVQFDKFASHDGKNLKIMSPWGFRTCEDIKFTWTHPTWNTRESFQYMSLLPAVIDFKYQHHVAINFMLVKPQQPTTVTIGPLEPLVIMHPLTEKKVVIKNHLVSEKEYSRLFSIEELVLNRDLNDEVNEYNRKKNLTTKIENLSCPFKEK